MREGEYFRAALANFMFDVSSGEAIRHLADKGYTVAKIIKHLDFPVSYERVQQTVWEHFLRTGVLRTEEPGMAGQKEEYGYVTEYHSYGRKSFRRVTLSSSEKEEIVWTEKEFAGKTGKEFASYLTEHCIENGEETAYVSCDFGLRSRQEPERHLEVLGFLEENDREYVQGLLWENKKIYHRLNKRMRDIVISLYKKREFIGICYFMKIKEKISVDSSVFDLAFWAGNSQKEK